MYPLNIHQALAIEEVYLRVRRDYRDPFSEWTTRRVESIAPLETVHDPNGWWHLVFADDLPLPILLTPACWRSAGARSTALVRPSKCPAH